MPRGGARQALTDTDKARVLATLAANDGNVTRTARECSVSPSSVRSWRDAQARGTGPSVALVAAAATEFVHDAERVRNKALTMLEERIEEGTIKPSELITTIGVLDDKIRLAKGLATKHVEHSSALPPAAELQAVLAGVVQGAIAAAERRDQVIDAEVVDEIPETT